MEIDEMFSSVDNISFKEKKSEINFEKILKIFLQNLTIGEFNSEFFTDKIKILNSDEDFDDYNLNEFSQRIRFEKLSIAIVLKSVSVFSTREVLNMIRKIFYIDVNKQNLEKNLKNNKKLLSSIIQSHKARIEIYLDLLIRYQIQDRSLYKLACQFSLMFLDKIFNNKISLDFEEVKKLKIILVILMFFPNCEFIDLTLEFISQIIEMNFKYVLSRIENKSEWNSFFFDLFKKEFIESLLIDYNPPFIFDDKFSNKKEIPKIIFENIITKELIKRKTSVVEIFYMRDCLILFFIFNYKTNFNLMREKFIGISITMTTSENNFKKLYEDFFKSISFFQDCFMGNFFLQDMLAFIRSKYNNYLKTNSRMISKLENVIVNYMATICKLFYTETDNLNIIFQKQPITKEELNDSIRYINREEFIKNIINTFTKSFSNKALSVENINYEQWKILVKKNPILTAIVSIEVIKEKGNEFISKKDTNFNFNNIFKAEKELLCLDLIADDVNTIGIINLIKIFLKSLCIVYIIFNSDINSYSFLLHNRNTNSNNTDVYENVLKYNTEIILIIWRMKRFLGNYYSYIQEDSEKLINDIISNRDECILYIVNNYFDEDMIKYILENIESSHISSKYIDDYINSKTPDKILNGLLLLGYWAYVYPLKYIYTRILDIIFILKKNVDLRSVLTSEGRIHKLCKGIYLLFKAFPKLHDEFLSLLNYLKTNLSFWISDYDLRKYANRMLDRSSYFVERVMISSDYKNENTLRIELHRNNDNNLKHNKIPE